MKYGDVKLIPLNSEKSLQVQIGNVVFLDSYQFLSTSLDALVASLAKSGKETFVTPRNLSASKTTYFKKVFSVTIT